MAELQAAHAKAMQNAKRLQSSAIAQSGSSGSQPHGTQPAPSSVHLDIAPFVQRADISQVPYDSVISSVNDELGPASNTGEIHENSPAGAAKGGPAVPDDSGGRARRSSIFQQTAVGIKNIVKIATGSAQVAPALFEEVCPFITPCSSNTMRRLWTCNLHLDQACNVQGA